MSWENRIIGHGVKPAGEFLANEDNWRIHPYAQQEALGGALNEVGWIQDVIVNKRTSEEWSPNQRGVETLLDGHLRIRLALRQERGEDEPVPYKEVDLTPAQEHVALLTLDPLAAMAIADGAKYDELRAQIDVSDEALRLLIEETARSAGAFIPPDVEPPEGFQEYDDGIATDYCCPKCGYEWSGKPK